MAENSGAPLFANRYRFEPVSEDWDRRHDRLIQLAFDLQTERLGIIKRAETTSEHAARQLRDEMQALQLLKGLGVPEVYESGEAQDDSRNYFYFVLEYADGVQVEKNLDSLTAPERVEILTQFFGLLSKAHQMGIVNGDVDLKHLLWRGDKKQLIVVDWGNARLGVDPQQKTEFVDDLARAAGIIFSLVTRHDYPMPMRSFALPDESGLLPELPKVPIEFRNICLWAPRSPAEGAPYHTASELFEASMRWGETVHGNQPHRTSHQLPGRTRWALPIISGIGITALLLIFTFFGGLGMLQSMTANSTLAPTGAGQLITTDLPIVNTALPPTDLPTATSIQPTESISTPTNILVPAISPAPGTYTEPILIFDKSSPSNNCWADETNLQTNLWTSEGFTRRIDGHWRFGIEKGRTTEQFVQSDFSQCLGTGPVGAIALNAWIVQLEIERESPENPEILEPGREFGFFIEDNKGERREYTIWVDRDEATYLRIRENRTITYNESVSIVNEDNLNIEEIYPRFYAAFPLQLFFEINNNGLDIIYLKQGPLLEAVVAEDMNPSQMVRIDEAVRSTLGDIQKIGLVGYGGETQTVIWPLVFFGE